MMMQIADAKLILAVPLSWNWKRPPGRSPITWLNTTQQRDLRTYNLTLNEAVDLAQNCPLCTLMSTYGATHYALLVVHDRKEEEGEGEEEEVLKKLNLTQQKHTYTK